MESFQINSYNDNDLRYTAASAVNNNSRLAKVVDKQEETLQEEAALDINTADVKKAVEKINNALKAFSKEYHFKYMENLERFQVSIVDKNTGEVVKEIPPKEVIQLAEKMQETVSVLIDQYS